MNYMGPQRITDLVVQRLSGRKFANIQGQERELNYEMRKLW